MPPPPPPPPGPATENHGHALHGRIPNEQDACERADYHIMRSEPKKWVCSGCAADDAGRVLTREVQNRWSMNDGETTAPPWILCDSLRYSDPADQCCFRVIKCRSITMVMLWQLVLTSAATRHVYSHSRTTP